MCFIMQCANSFELFYWSLLFHFAFRMLKYILFTNFLKTFDDVLQEVIKVAKELQYADTREIFVSGSIYCTYLQNSPSFIAWYYIF